MMTRLEQIVFALSEASEQRAGLKKVLKDTALSVKTVADLNPQALHDQGVRRVIFDFDGVLAPHGDLSIGQKELDILKTFAQVFGVAKLSIWSNNPIPARMKFVQQHFPEINWISGLQKPNPEALKQFMQTQNCEPKTVLVLDDRLLTGILAGLLAGTQVRLLKKPMVRLKGNFTVELSFMLLRALERFVFRF